MMIISTLVIIVLFAPVILLGAALAWVHNLFVGAGGDTKVGSGDFRRRGRAIITAAEARMQTYPWRKLFKTRADVIRAYELVRKYEWKLVPQAYTITNMPELLDTQLIYKPEAGSVICETQPADYYTMNWLSDWFNERARLSCKRYDEAQSPLDYWRDHRDEVIKACRPLTYEALSDEMYSRVRGCNNFRPGIMAGAIKYFGAKSVLDWCAGHGDRLIGAIAAGVRYVGVDPNSTAHRGYREIIDMFAKGDDKSELRPKYTMIEAPFQAAELPQGETYDLVFTSPPYRDLEEYDVGGDRAGQSTVEFTTDDSWFNGFLAVCIEKAWGVLNPGGHMITVINNIRGRPDFVRRMINYTSELPGADYLGVISYADKVRDGYKSPQPMWVWRKYPLSGGLISCMRTCGVIPNHIAGGSLLPVTEVPGCTIAPLVAEHIDALADIASDPAVMKNIANGAIWPRDKIASLIEYERVDNALPVTRRQYFHWVILHAETARGAVGSPITGSPITGSPTLELHHNESSSNLIGYVGLYPLGSSAADRGKLQVRIFLAADQQGKGYGAYALYLALREYKKMIANDVKKVLLYMQMAPDNIGSVKLAQKLGFTESAGQFHISGKPTRRFSIALD